MKTDEIKTANPFVEKLQQASFSFDFLSDFRSKASSRFSALNYPTTKHEEWRFISLKEVSRTDFAIKAKAAASVDVSSYLLKESVNSTIVFVNGIYQAKLSKVSGLPKGTVVTTFQNADEKQLNEIETYLGSLTFPKDDFFAELNSSLVDDGVLIFIPKETKIESPIHVLHIVTEDSGVCVLAPRCLILAEAFSKATVIEDFVGISSNVYMNIPVTEVHQCEGSVLKHFRIQRESKSAFHFNRIGTSLDKSSDYQSYTIHFGSKLSRADVRADLIGEQANCILDGLVLIDGIQESDTHTVMHHQFPHCTSHQLHKVLVDDEAHSVFNGKIWVDQLAQKTDSFQENRNILLSDVGRINTKPQLEIFADDVRCSHGATIGQLDAEEIFYLKSRGLNEATAKELLMYGYALEVIENIDVESLKKQLSDYVSVFAHTKVEFSSTNA